MKDQLSPPTNKTTNPLKVRRLAVFTSVAAAAKPKHA